MFYPVSGRFSTRSPAMKTRDGFLTDAQLKAELDRCEYCEEKPCLAACPAGCSPADFIMAARAGGPSDYRRAAAMILGANPLGGVCGLVCPDTFCMRACSLRKFDRPIEIPAVQATIVHQAKAAGLERFAAPPWNGKKVAVVGSGPAGLGAAALLAQKGYRITIFEQQERPGGMMNLIPDFRLNKDIVRGDIDFIRQLGVIDWVFDANIEHPAQLAKSGLFDAVVVCAGLTEPMRLGIPGEDHALSWRDFLSDSGRKRVAGKRVAILGGGAVASDCATMARRRGARSVEIVYRRKQEHMPLAAYERELLLTHGVEITSCARPLEIVVAGGKVKGMRLARMTLPPGKAPRPENFVVNRKESPVFREFDVVISAIGSRAKMKLEPAENVFPAGDLVLGAATVVEAVASGKDAALRLDAHLRGERGRKSREPVRRCPAILAGWRPLPVPLDAEFFGRRIRSPFLLSAAPHTDGYDQMRLAYERGWAGGVMKTAFDHGPIHIPAGYMFVLGASTYGNCDNVSGHFLDRVRREVGELVREFPDRLTLASTGGPLTGRDEEDKAVWQSNTRQLEEAGAMGVEYSLSCPQGGDGTHGDVAAQNAELTARIVDWVLETGDGGVPKLFKLTAAVTAIAPIMQAVREAFARHPGKKAGVTLANSFPALAFRPVYPARREKGVIIGLSGEGVLPISNLTLARVAGLGVTISGNGGAMDCRAAARFLALGAETVQFCTVVMKHGLGVVGELHSGLSHLLAERGYRSVRELIGSARPDPIAGFESLAAEKQLPEVLAELCQSCGNCARCPYQAIALDRRGVPAFDAARCVGCSLCAQKCFAGAIFMRPRTARELAAFSES